MLYSSNWLPTLLLNRWPIVSAKLSSQHVNRLFNAWLKLSLQPFSIQCSFWRYTASTRVIKMLFTYINDSPFIFIALFCCLNIHRVQDSSACATLNIASKSKQLNMKSNDLVMCAAIVSVWVCEWIGIDGWMCALLRCVYVFVVGCFFFCVSESRIRLSI